MLILLPPPVITILFLPISIIGQAQRKRVWDYLKTNLLEQGNHVLELNCGTGEDAVWLAQQACSVVATDVSMNILAVAENKVKQFNLSDKIVLEKLDLKQVQENNFTEKFDLVFSNFGGFNCLSIEELTKLNVWIKNRLVVRGEAILVIMPEDTLFEKLFALKHWDFKRIKERKSKAGMLVNVNGVAVQTYFYNWQKIAEVFSNFEVIQVFPLGLMPSYLNEFATRNKRFWAFVQYWENWLSRRKKMPNWGDHFILHLRAKHNDAEASD